MGNEFNLKKGDSYPAIRAQLKVWDPATEAYIPFQIPSGTTVKFRMSIAGGSNPLVDAAASIVYPSEQSDPLKAGVVEYTFPNDGTETNTVGTHLAEWRLTFPSGQKATFPRGQTPNFNEVKIEEEVV